MVIEVGTWLRERKNATVNAIRDYTLSRSRCGLVILYGSDLRAIYTKAPWWACALARKVLTLGPLRHKAVVNETPDDYIHQHVLADGEWLAVDDESISSRRTDAAGTRHARSCSTRA